MGTGPGSENIATKAWRRANPAVLASKKMELESLRKRISAYERAGITGSGLNSMKLRAQQLEEEIQAAGGKYHRKKRKAGGKRSSDKTKYHSYGGLKLASYSITDSDKASFERRSRWSSAGRRKR